MEVKQVNGEGPPLAAVKKGKGEEPGGPQFQKLLQEAQAGLPGPRPAPSREGAARGADLEAPNLFPLPPLSLAPKERAAPVPASQGARAAEKTLDLLDRYHRAVADPLVSLKEAYPLLQSASREVEKLAEQAGPLSPSDPLRKIIAEIEVLSAVEMERFNRGDYL